MRRASARTKYTPPADKQIARYHAGEQDADGVLLAAQSLLRTMSPEAVEDREYYFVDLDLPAEKRCRHEGPYGRTCSRRANHVSADHRCMEISWTNESTERAQA
jgi:hypothetical protein